MTGLEAINNNNGWIMSVVGAIIVFLGLIVLSTAISQLKHIINFFARRAQKPSVNEKGSTEASPKAVVTIPDPFPMEINAAAAIYQPLFAKLGPSFQLEDLYAACREAHLPHPHYSITAFRQAGLLVADAERQFSWHLEV